MVRNIMINMRYGLVCCAVLASCCICCGEALLRIQDGPAWAASEEAASPQPEAGATVDNQQLAALIQQQKNLITRETGQLKREIAALREDLSKPGIKEIFAGIGYILGLAGVGLYAHCRKTRLKQAGS
jgi:hypothetical protein